MRAAADAAGRIDWSVSVDSTISCAINTGPVPVVTGASRRTTGWDLREPADHALGRSRGGWTTKTHLACEEGRKVLATVVTAGPT
ncbi:hypothetical protein M3G91_00780 [Micromonospora chalcea]|uniref:hypothetical protein n=1 Tax=Micromonospora chalcea TaxID=1874 RepID=UPI0021A2819D|nr:hypothetical protein [Micromonospora chalcea]MCT2276142.1 hypothetical protein [Micromonospora chalcea]